jgi:hypothetical protein
MEGVLRGLPRLPERLDGSRAEWRALVAIGRSVCAIEPELDGPAIWTATVRDNKVAGWRVYEDTRANRIRLGLDDR